MLSKHPNDIQSGHKHSLDLHMLISVQRQYFYYHDIEDIDEIGFHESKELVINYRI